MGNCMWLRSVGTSVWVCAAGHTSKKGWNCSLRRVLSWTDRKNWVTSSVLVIFACGFKWDAEEEDKMYMIGSCETEEYWELRLGFFWGLSCSIKRHVTSSDASLISTAVTSLNNLSAIICPFRGNYTGFWEFSEPNPCLENWFSQGWVRSSSSEQVVLPSSSNCLCVSRLWLLTVKCFSCLSSSQFAIKLRWWTVQ